MSEISDGVLLDTHLWIWLQQGDSRASRLTAKFVDEARSTNSAFVSAISVWEIGMLEWAGRISLNHPIEEWVKMAYSRGRLRPIPVSSEIALLSTRLPGNLHRDPADRILVATAQHMDLTLLTRDDALLAYAKQGHLRARRI